jgi:flagellar biosynthesis GTPase FlhF
LDEEAARKAAIEESRRKLAELEADRPLWEEQAKRREMLERREEEARRAKREQQRREEAETAKAEKRVQEKEEREAREREDRKREEMARREWERRQRQQRWSTGPWTTQRALERYKNLCEYFDTTKFSLDEPLAFDVVPWPILQSPMSFTVEDVDWGAVERFFEAMKPHMRAQDYNTFVEKSQRRFHPDRWRSRGLLKSVEDDVERGCLEVAANTVAQALTPLWRELTGRC